MAKRKRVINIEKFLKEGRGQGSLENYIPWYGVSQTLKDKVHYYSPAFTGVSSIKVRTYDPDYDMTVTLYECKYGGKVVVKKTGIVDKGWSEIPFTGLDSNYYYYFDYYYSRLFASTDTITVELKE